MEELVSTYKIQFGSLGRKYSEIAFDVQRWRELMTLVKTVTVQTEKGGVRIDFDWGMLWEIMELKNEIDKAGKVGKGFPTSGLRKFSKREET